uniref:Eukaryotic peptide chain release factor subunit 1 n=1 Tax=Rhinopithecus bieti TaxID=61621 RepID=A0A2K6MW65_RHIBE
MVDDPSAVDRKVEIWKIKKLIKSSEAACSNGTSVVSLIIPPKDQISPVAKMLADEFGTASNIKAGINPITSIQQRLKLYNKVPPDGLVVYCGTTVTEEGKEKKGNDSKFGFVETLREVLHKFTVDLPKKHSGGQLALRFACLKMEKRHNHVQKVAETAVQLFISGDKMNVAGLVLAGSADFELSQSGMFDQRLQQKVLKLVVISYGGENGFNQATELSTEVLSKDTPKYCFGVEDTLKALEMGAVEILMVYENLDIMTYVLHCQDQEKDKSHFTDKETGQEHELIESTPLLEWFANNYKKFAATLEIVTDKTQEGSWFVKGSGGTGGILRYRADFQGMEYQGGDNEFFDLDDY